MKNKPTVKTIIIEDEEANRIALHGLLQLYCPQVNIIDEATDVDSGYNSILQHQPQLVLLDIRLGERTAFDLLERFENIDFQIIILTAYSIFEYAQQGIRYGVKAYLLKPYRIDDLKMAIENAIASIPVTENSNPKSIIVPSANGHNVIHTESIILLQADGAYTHVCLANDAEYLVSKNLKHFEEQLNFPPFFRTHDSTIVNFNHIALFQRDGQVGRLELTNQKSAPVAARKLGDFIEKFKEFIEKR